ncbi:hypothetical protein LS64_009735 [Helicobacter saguini]|uniref:Uncharacterized protein n=2 Tax=Helicobacter saguini TaxID=1548018 RepID=A0A347VNP5_9HELI|nr:hypothetical protein [Helicobacter saguini]MWV69993.1 hypothetical protein [Helicobacter saguini]MWV72793.1 hypothetical protein [Helicobacter saguini]TLD92695.1 hypothetical protein LS64_009735 [Helicobacter saguini]
MARVDLWNKICVYTSYKVGKNMKKIILFLICFSALNAESSDASWGEILQDSTKAAQKLMKDIESKNNPSLRAKDSERGNPNSMESKKDSNVTKSVEMPKVAPTKLPKVTPTTPPKIESKKIESKKQDSINVPSIEVPNINIPEIHVPKSSNIESKNLQNIESRFYKNTKSNNFESIKLADSSEIQKAPYIPTIKNVTPLKDSNIPQTQRQNLESNLQNMECKDDSPLPCGGGLGGRVKNHENKGDSKKQDSINQNTESKTQDSKKNIESKNTKNPQQKTTPNIRDFRDDFNINKEANPENVEITQNPAQSQDEALQIDQQEYDEQLAIEKHDVEIKKRLDLDPLFTAQRAQIGGGYHAMLALGDTQTLIFNAAFANAQLPLNLRIFALNIYGGASWGKADMTLQDISIQSQYFSANGGAQLSIPLTRKFVVAHAVLGGEYGIGNYSTGIDGSAINEINGFAGVDFVYNDFVFRPYLGSVFYFFNMDSLKSGLLGGINGYLGFNTFYIHKKTTGNLAVSISRDFLRPSGGIFLIMPIQNNALYLGQKSTNLNVDFGIEMAASRHFVIKGNAQVSYNLSYYVVTALIKVSAYFRF